MADFRVLQERKVLQLSQQHGRCVTTAGHIGIIVPWVCISTPALGWVKRDTRPVLLPGDCGQNKREGGCNSKICPSTPLNLHRTCSQSSGTFPNLGKTCAVHFSCPALSWNLHELSRSDNVITIAIVWQLHQTLFFKGQTLKISMEFTLRFTGTISKSCTGRPRKWSSKTLSCLDLLGQLQSWD